MRKAERKQNDDLQEEYSYSGGLACTAEEDVTRQEFKDETDINKLLTRYGGNVPLRAATYGGTVDDNIDLQQALGAIADAKHAWRNLPENLRNRYTDWRQLLNALENGQLKLHTEEPIATPPAPPQS